MFSLYFNYEPFFVFSRILMVLGKNSISMRCYLIFFLAFLMSFRVFSQTDRVFWFAAPDVSTVHGPYDPDNGRPINLHITAQYATHVTISRPADAGFTPIELDLAQMEHITLRLDNANGTGLFDFDEIENYDSPNLLNGMGQNGFLIESDPGEITAYYELDNINNRDIFPLKGRNALGQDFWVSTQNHWPNGDYGGTAWSGFVICATEDNTTVTVYQNDDWLHFPGPAVREVVLDAGETFVFRAESTDADRHINGVHVTSDKDIVITIYDDSVHKQPYGCKDIIGDQIVPVELIGQEYIVMKGFLDDEERIFITGTVNGTQVTVGGAAPVTIDAGEVYTAEVTDRATRVYATRPIYLNHLTGFGCELGGALLPTIDGCTGSNDVTFTRTPSTTDGFFLNIMVRNDTSDASPSKNQSIFNFTLEVDNVVFNIPETFFEFIQDSAFAVLKDENSVHQFFANRINPGNEAQISNPIARFHLGVVNGGPGDGCKYGYFSDYAANVASAGIGGALAETQDVYCNMDPILLVASGGNAYDWSCISDPSISAYLSDSTAAAPYFYPPDTNTYQFSVKIFGECSQDTTIYMTTIVKHGPTSDFILEDIQGCSPFATSINNTTVGNPKIMKWAMGEQTNQVDQDTMPNPFVWNFPPNNTDTVQNYSIKLYTYQDEFFSCLSMREKTVKILPELNAGFSITDTIGCHPLHTNFINESTGHLDSTSYLWDFGDNSQSFYENPDHLYNNFGLEDTIYSIQLKTESPFGCLDSISHDITVHPRVRAAMAIETGASCSPLDITINPGNSIGVDTFYWHIDYFYDDSSYTTQSDAPISLFHRDTSIVSGPDTLDISMWAVNRMGCVDSFPERNIIVFPEVSASFDIDNDEICDEDSIQFTNTSFGYELFYNWDFDDGAVIQDTTGTLNPWHAFYNRSDIDSAYNIRLTATSGYFCEDEFDTLITVHPFIKANFGLDYDNNCTPLLASFSDLSIRSHFYEWDFGDNSISTTTDSTFTHLYWNESSTSDTTYYIRLVTENNEGCTDTLIRSLSIFPHVVASFDMTDTVGCSPLTTSFTNSSSGGLLSYLWDFGNSTTSTSSAPSFDRTFSNLGHNDTTFYLSLTAANPYGCDSTTYDSVVVYASIDADFNLPQVDSCSPFTVRPANLSSLGAKTFEWTFIGDGFTSGDFEPIVPTFNNTSLETDTIVARLIAYGENNPEHQACADTHSVQVLVFPELDIDYGLDMTESCQPFMSDITPVVNLLGGNSFVWTLDSVFYSSANNPPPLNVGNLRDVDESHTLRFSGQSQYGCRDTAWHSFEVFSLVDAGFTINKSGICSADSFQVDRRTSRGGIISYQWDFGGTTENMTDSMFFYSFENTAESDPVLTPVKLTVYNAHSCPDSLVRTINVYPEVRADFTIDSNFVCYPYSTEFANNTENASNYNWDFGDGTGSNDRNPEPHVFENFDKVSDQNFTIRLIARSDYNCYDSINQPLTIFAKPDAEFYFPVSVDCPPFNAAMVNESQGYMLDYYWDFDDADPSSDPNPTHLFDNTGSAIRNVPITLTVTSGGGKSCIDALTRTLRVYPKPHVDFTRSFTEGCTPLSVSFTGDTTNISNLVWSIDDNSFSSLTNPSYRFVNETADNIIYNVNLQGTSSYNCSHDTTKTITVFPGPIAEFIPDPIVQDYNTEEDQTTVTFYNETTFQDNWSYAWDYGDGTADDQPGYPFEHIYGFEFWGDKDNNGEIPISLVAWNTDNPECRDTVRGEIFIKPPLPQIALEADISGCEPFTIDFTATTKYVYDDQLEWDFGETGAYSTEVEPTYTYNSEGVYTAKLVVRGDGGTNWDYRIITVHPKPEVDFSFNDSLVFVRSQNRPDEVINFYNRTRFGENYEWYFENNLDMGVPDEVTQDKDPTWYYEETGTYYVALVAISDESCMDTLVHPVPIEVLGEASIQFPTGFFVDPAGARDEWVSDPQDTDIRIFRPYAQGVEEYKLEVYNRWGVLVFKSDDVNRGWNGYIDGKPAKQDVYVWRAKGRFTNGQPYEMSGDVTLIVAPVSGEQL